MFLQDFFDAKNKNNIDFGDLMWVYTDQDSEDAIEDILEDDYAYECFIEIAGDHPKEVNYYGCYVDYDVLRIYVDTSNVEALIEKYYPDYYQD